MVTIGLLYLHFCAIVSLLHPHALLDTVGVIGTSALKYMGTEQILFAVASIGVSRKCFFSLMIIGSSLKRLHISGKVFIILNKLSALFILGTAVLFVY